MLLEGMATHSVAPIPHLHRLVMYPLKKCSWRRFGTVEPPRTRIKELYIPCYLCEDVVREGLDEVQCAGTSQNQCILHPAHLVSPEEM